MLPSLDPTTIPNSTVRFSLSPPVLPLFLSPPSLCSSPLPSPPGAAPPAPSALRRAPLQVVDEADMLLSGGYARALARLLSLMRLEERRVAREREGEKERGRNGRQNVEVGVSGMGDFRTSRLGGPGEVEVEGEGEGEGDELPWTEFPREVDEEGRAVKGSEEEGDDYAAADEEWEERERETSGRQVPRGAADRLGFTANWTAVLRGTAERGREGAEREAAAGEGEVDGGATAGGAGGPAPGERTGGGRQPRSGWRRAQRSFGRSKQYVFVAATLPAGSRKSVAEVLARQFPDAAAVSGRMLHRSNPRWDREGGREEGEGWGGEGREG